MREMEKFLEVILKYKLSLSCSQNAFTFDFGIKQNINIPISEFADSQITICLLS